MTSTYPVMDATISGGAHSSTAVTARVTGYQAVVRTVRASVTGEPVCAGAPCRTGARVACSRRHAGALDTEQPPVPASAPVLRSRSRHRAPARSACSWRQTRPVVASAGTDDGLGERPRRAGRRRPSALRVRRRTPEQLSRWCARLDAYDIPLGPHGPRRRQPALRRPDRASAPGSRSWCPTPRRWSRSPPARLERSSAAGVVGRRCSPTRTSLPSRPSARVAERPRDRFRVGLHLKSLRANVAAAPVVRALVAATEPLPGAEVSVHLHREVVDPGHPRHDADLLALLTRLDDAGPDLPDRARPAYRRRAVGLPAGPRPLGAAVCVRHPLRLARGLLRPRGPPVLAPRTGFWTEQRPCATFGWEPDGPSVADIAAAVDRCYAERPVWQATRGFRAAEQRDLATWHRGLYRRLVDTPHGREAGSVTLVGWYAHHLGSGHVARALTVGPADAQRRRGVELCSPTRGLAGGPLGTRFPATTTRAEPTMPRAAPCTGRRSAIGATAGEWP